MGRDMGRTSEVPAPGPGGSEALRIEGLHKSFGPHEVLRGVDLAVATARSHVPDRRVGIGEIDVAALREPARADRRGDHRPLRAVDHPTRASTTTVRRHIGMVFQSFNLFPHMTVQGNVTLARTKVRALSRTDVLTKAAELLDRFGLVIDADSTRIDSPAANNSGSRSSGR